MTDLDKQLLELASTDPEKFLRMIGEEKWTVMKVCFLRDRKNSYGMIIRKLDRTIDAVRWACKQCDG